MKYCITFFLAAMSFGCMNSAQPISQNTNTSNQPPARNEKPQTVTAHTTENQPAPSANSNGTAPYKSAGMGEPIDTAKFDGTIAAAEKLVTSKPADTEAKKDLAQAYYDRGFALTEARQYASALGDYRRALKLDPTHEDSKNWIKQITDIYAMLKKDAPKEGEEPPPLPFKKS
ncbi:MAG: tetratricopeptide repeat protein [Acidobacteria bacterium]|nr:tetratricopeptide repeat protein [Acidobacteriota bacterium]